MPKLIKPEVGKFMVLDSPVRRGPSTGRPYVDVTGNGRTYDTLPEAQDVAAHKHPKCVPVVVLVIETPPDVEGD